MIKNPKAWAAALLVAWAAYGCAASSGDEDEAMNNADQSEDALGLTKGAVDNAAIVESTTMMLAGGPLDGKLDPYNREDPFQINRGNYAGQFGDRLNNFDAYDGKADWTAAQKTAWVARMSSGNYQVIDTSKPCDWQNPHTYLEIERAALTGREHTTCGGRMPNEDAMDVTLNFLVRGPAASVNDEDALHDGVEQATKKSGDTFPYLAELNGL